MGAVLQQEQHGTIRVIAYATKTFDAAERMYCTTRKELAAVIYALKKFQHYVVGGVTFLLRTDRGASTSLFKTPEPIQQQDAISKFFGRLQFLNSTTCPDSNMERRMDWAEDHKL